METIEINSDNETLIDTLTYRSWWYQIHWYGVSYEKARLMYTDAERYEKLEKVKKTKTYTE